MSPENCGEKERNKEKKAKSEKPNQEEVKQQESVFLFSSLNAEIDGVKAVFMLSALLLL